MIFLTVRKFPREKKLLLNLWDKIFFSGLKNDFWLSLLSNLEELTSSLLRVNEFLKWLFENTESSLKMLTDFSIIETLLSSLIDLRFDLTIFCTYSLFFFRDWILFAILSLSDLICSICSDFSFKSWLVFKFFFSSLWFSLTSFAFSHYNNIFFAFPINTSSLKISFCS